MPPSLARIITTLYSLPGVLISTIIFVPTSLLLHHYIRTHGPIPSASTAIKLNSRLYAIISLYLLLSIALPASLTPSSLPKLLSNGQNDSYQRTAYHLSKLYEHVDIFNVLAAGGAVDLHFAFHHLTTPYLTLFRVVPDLPSTRGWSVFVALNCAHHVLMYAYFGGVAASWTRPVLPWTGVLQLVVGIWVEVGLLREELGQGRQGGEGGWVGLLGEERWRNGFAAGLLGCYLVLFLRDLRVKAKEKEVEAGRRRSRRY